MKKIYADLHVHIGKANGQYVKITASADLSLEKILFIDAPQKGLDMIGVVDSSSLAVSYEIRKMLETGQLKELEKGGFITQNGVVLILASEIESKEGFHINLYLPDLERLMEWQKILKRNTKNLVLSTQKTKLDINNIIKYSRELGAIICPAHAFTPHKGIYGFWTKRILPVLGEEFNEIKCLELGLSADSNLADMLNEVSSFTFLSNSDAHSSANIGREYNLLEIEEANFEELKFCIDKHAGRRVLANYGMDPRMGKYYRSYCAHCDLIINESTSISICPKCKKKCIMGVYDRIVEIRDYEQNISNNSRPPYNYRVPLIKLPGIGPSLYAKLIDAFANEIAIIESVPLEEIKNISGRNVADTIEQLRKGSLLILPGGGGKYGKIKKNSA